MMVLLSDRVFTRLVFVLQSLLLFGRSHRSALAFGPRPIISDRAVPLHASANRCSQILLHGCSRSDTARLEDEVRSTSLLLNQRKLPKQIMKCRDDDVSALKILGSAYSHLAFDIDTMQHMELSYEVAVDILLGERYEGSAVRNARDASAANKLMTDGKSIVATLEVLRKACNVPAALHILRMAVDGVHHNRLHRFQDGDGGDELYRVYKAVFSLLGNTHKRQGEAARTTAARLILYLLHEHMPNVTLIRPREEIYHAAINALGKIGACEELLLILDEMELESTAQAADVETDSTSWRPPPVDKMSYQTAISSLARNGNCNEATRLLYRMQSKGLDPDTNIYNELLIGVAKQAGRSNYQITAGTCDASAVYHSDDGVHKPWYEVACDVLHEMEVRNKCPTEQSFNSVISACSKQKKWDVAARVAEKASMLGSRKDECVQTKTTDLSSDAENNIAGYFQHLGLFRKRGKGKDSYWEIGRYCRFIGRPDAPDGTPKTQSIIIGIQPHRNTALNGLSLVFHEEASGVKLGRILLKNSSSHHSSEAGSRYYSSLVGMEVNKARRGEGLAKILVALWLRMCLETDSYPRAAVMNKPLIALVLNGFGFLPRNGGTRVELIRLRKNDGGTERNEDGYSPQFALYSTSTKSLQGLFSERVLRTQSIAIMDHPPSPEERGTAIYLKTSFEHPIAIADGAVDYNDGAGDGENVTVLPSQSEQRELNTNEVCQSAAQRTRLAVQIDAVLNCSTPNNEHSEPAQMELFSDSRSLKDALFLYAA